MHRLNVGCGRNPLVGWINMDKADLHGVDVVWDLATFPLPFEDDSIDEFLLSHVIEHINAPLPLMEELWRIAKPGARMIIRTPYGSSDDAWEDPTHVRPYFLQSHNYYSQPYYWRADYRYRGDWQPLQIELMVDARIYGGVPKGELLADVLSKRNVVQEMTCLLKAIKPAREPQKDLQTRPSIDFRYV